MPPARLGPSIVSWFFATWPGRIVTALVGLVLVLAAIGSVAYANDGAINADVTAKSCSHSGANAITAKTRLFSIVKTVPVDFIRCQAIPTGAFVQYHLRSTRVVVFEREGGACLWDTSVGGPCLS